MEYNSKSVADTQKIASEIAQLFQDQGGIIALIGDLGAGKTTFVQSFAQTLGITDKIISPTFILMRQHQLPHTDRWLFHLDLYRLEEKTSISELGLKDIFSDNKSIILIEWAEKVLAQLPPQTLKIYFKKTFDSERKINVLN